MRDYGYLRIMACSPRVRVADVRFNCETITEAIEAADAARAALVVFPELSLTGYTCGDLFGQNLLIDKAEEAAKEIVRVSRAKAVTIVVGVPIRFGGHLYNCAAVIRNGRLKGLVPKIYLPTYNEFYEARWFASGAAFLGSPETVKYAGQTCVLAPAQLFSIGKASFAVELCEDLWTPVPPSSCHALAGAEVIVNLSASNEVLLKHTYRRSLVAGQSARTVSAYVYCGAGYGESTQDVVFAGSSFICENGTFLAENERFRMDGSSVVADVDIEKLTVLRQKENTFQAKRFGFVFVQ
jgi:NAD+ synthase (glutamine-hydrolysing)